MMEKTSTFWAKDVCVEFICCRDELCSYFYAVASHTDGYHYNVHFIASDLYTDCICSLSAVMME